MSDPKTALTGFRSLSQTFEPYAEGAKVHLIPWPQMQEWRVVRAMCGKKLDTSYWKPREEAASCKTCLYAATLGEERQDA